MARSEEACGSTPTSLEQALATSSMAGDVNLFLLPNQDDEDAVDDEEGQEQAAGSQARKLDAEVEVMIAGELSWQLHCLSLNAEGTLRLKIVVKPPLLHRIITTATRSSIRVALPPSVLRQRRRPTRSLPAPARRVPGQDRPRKQRQQSPL